MLEKIFRFASICMTFKITRPDEITGRMVIDMEKLSSGDMPETREQRTLRRTCP